MSLFFTSDLHFSHKQIIEYSKRPFSSVEEMNAILISNWNKKVQDNDIIFILGDLTLCPFKEFAPIANQLRGKKILIKGNHDAYSDGQYNKLGFTVYHELKMKLFGKNVRLSHYPYALPWYKQLFAFASEKRFLDRRPPRIKGEWLFHGHSHVKYRKADTENRIHIGVDAWNYSPVSSNELESLMSKQYVS